MIKKIGLSKTEEFKVFHIINRIVNLYSISLGISYIGIINICVKEKN